MSLCASDHGVPPPQMALSEASLSTSDNLRDRPEMGVFVLPGGYVDNGGVAHYEVEMLPVTGRVEEYLGSLPGNTALASAVTGLLAMSVKRIGSIRNITSSLIADLLVGDRDYLILRLREMTFGPRVDAMIRCPNSTCGKMMDLSLSLDDFTIERKAVKQRSFLTELNVCSAGTNPRPLVVELQLPTGAFQEAASALVNLPEEKAVDRLLSLCIKRLGNITDLDDAAVEAMPVEIRAQIEAAIQQHAPAVEIEIEAGCPECHHTFLFPVDFNKFFFAELKDNLRNLEFEVHFLAKNYHWAESEILSMTRRKRQRYISLLQQEMDL